MSSNFFIALLESLRFSGATLCSEIFFDLSRTEITRNNYKANTIPVGYAVKRHYSETQQKPLFGI